MGRRCDPSELRQFAAALRPGAVLHLYSHLAGKPKYHALISAADERSLAFIINTRPSQLIERQPDLLRRQVLMQLSAHPFMGHDSYIACHDTVALPTRSELIDGLLQRAIDHVGRLDAGVYAHIAAAAQRSALIAERDSALITAAFGSLTEPTGDSG
jgi:hypothetical protein